MCRKGRSIREVYERARMAASEIDYLEAHGSGTAVGDPIETRAIGEALGCQRPAGAPLPVGSIIGHLEAAAAWPGSSRRCTTYAIAVFPERTPGRAQSAHRLHLPEHRSRSSATPAGS
jgi:hypothetical protein